MITAQDLKDFEAEIADLYGQGKIPFPIHLRGSLDNQYEHNLIQIFKRVKPEDYIYGYWASHAHCLLKGVPRQELLDSILRGNSISLCFPEHNIYCSGIVGSLVGVAAGTAFGLKRSKSKGKVHIFCGDMASQNGNFYEAVKYAWANILPITFYVEDNGVSVLTDTEKAWGVSCHDTIKNLQESYPGYVEYFHYTNSHAHSGINRKVKF